MSLLPIQREFELIDRDTTEAATRAVLRKLSARGVAGAGAGTGSLPQIKLVTGTYSGGAYAPYLRCDVDDIDSGRGCAP